MNKSNVDLGLSVGFGLMAGSRAIFGIGNNPDMDTGAQEDVWSGGGLYPWMTAATSLEVLSSSALDTAAGTGARTVVIRGLDANYNEVTLSVTMNGITPVALPSQLLRINNFMVATSGSVETNVGGLTIRDAGGGTTRALITGGYGISRQSQFTVPAGYTMQIVYWLNCINRPIATQDATLGFYYKPFGGSVRIPLELTVNGAGTPSNSNFMPGPIASEKSDFGIRCTFTSSNNVDITSSWTGIMVKNTDLIFL